MCFDYGLVLSVGFVLQENRRIYKNRYHRQVLEEGKTAPIEIQQQMQDNIQWIKGAQENKLVVGHKREFFMPMEGRVKIASAFNQAIAKGDIGTIVLGRDHHDVSGTDSPYRRHQTSTTDPFTADMAIQNVIGDSFRGATWVSIHNGGGVGWER
jgi:urocanate hydratase